MYSIQRTSRLAGAALPLLGLLALGCASQEHEPEVPASWGRPSGPQAELLHAKAQGTKEKLPAEALAVIVATNKELADSDALARALKTGQIAPNFALPDALGNTVSLSELLASGPVVVTFYRGHW